MIKAISFKPITKVLFITSIVTGLILVSLFTITKISKASSSANFPGTVAEDTSVGSVSWSNYSNVTSSNNSRATVESVGNYTTYYIKATNFGFAIPTGATIDGILVEWEKQVGNGGTGNTRDGSVKLVKGGTISGDDKASASVWPANASETFVSYGGSSDLWGLTWVPSDINSSNFGVVLAAQSVDGGTKNFEVDSVRITIYYTEGPTLKVFKTPTETTSNDATLSNDSDLQLLNLEANKTYLIDGALFASSTSGVPDLQLAFSIPSGAVVDIGYIAASDGALREAELLQGTGAVDITSSRIPITGNTPTIIQVHGTVQMGSTAGNVVLKWAQATSNANPTSVIEGSYLRAENIED